MVSDTVFARSGPAAVYSTKTDLAKPRVWLAGALALSRGDTLTTPNDGVLGTCTPDLLSALI